MKHLRIKEILCVVVLAVFIFAVVAQNKRVSDAAAADVGAAVSAAVGLEQLSLRDDKAFKKVFGLDAAQFEDDYYAASDDVMEVRELLVVRLKKDDNGALLTQTLRQRMEDKITLFEGYAPEQTALLKNYKLVRHGNYLLFAVCNTPANAVKAFRSAL